MKLYILAILSIISWNLQSEIVLNPSEILHRYQPQMAIDKAETELNFWQKKYYALPSQEQTYGLKLALAHETLFSLTGSIEDLRKSERLLSKVLESEMLNRPGVERILAKNMISQHRFCEALDLVISARQSGRDVSAADLMLFDIYLELGEESLAIDHLDQIKDQSSFDYLIRKAKWEDHKGNLEMAIAFLEEAKTIAIKSNNRVQLSWIYSNLGDFYGHHGDYEESKTHFIKALEVNPADWYSLKGLAFMSWSLNDDFETALSLINTIQLYNVSPALGWLKYEIYSSQSNDEATTEKNQVIAAVNQEVYGAMYNHLLYEDAISSDDYQKALSIARDKVASRPTAHSFAMLAHALYKNKELNKGIEIANRYVIGKTYEPSALLFIYPLYTKDTAEYQAIRNELMGARYELGENAYKEFLAL